MSHHDVSHDTAIDPAEQDANSRADALAIFSLVVIIVSMAVFFASH